MDGCKPWWKSKTLLFNALAGTCAAAESSLYLLQPLLGEHTYLILLFGVTVGNALLRVLTTQALRA